MGLTEVPFEKRRSDALGRYSGGLSTFVEVLGVVRLGHVRLQGWPRLVALTRHGGLGFSAGPVQG